jgi:hypothetical protein
MEILNSLIGKLFGFDHALVILYVVAFNSFLSGVYKGLSLIKDKTASNIDNKAYEIVGKIISMLMKVLDYVGYNLDHKK